MATSRSGLIRQSIGPARSHLVSNIDIAADIIASEIPQILPDFQKQLDDINEVKNKIDKGIVTLTKSDNKWQDLMLKLDESLIAEEERLYAKVAVDPTSGYLVIVEKAGETLCSLERRHDELSRAMVSIGPGPAQHAQVGFTSAKLPKLHLPTFSGDHFEWPSFWNIFSVNVHERGLSAAEKFSYLQAQLSGPALNSIAGITVTAANYPIAIAILRERYERSATQMVGALYSQLKKLPMSSDKVSDLMGMYDSCERIFRQLHAAGEEIDVNRSLILDVLGKYPKRVVKELMEKYDLGTDCQLKDIREALRKYIKQCEAVAEVMDDLSPFAKSTCHPKPSKVDMPNSEHQYSPTSAFTVATAQINVATSDVPKNPCYFCAGPHFNSRCDKYKTIVERRDRIRELSRCFRCLGTGHQQSSCRIPANRIKCFFCKVNGEHVSPMCPQEFSKTTPNSNCLSATELCYSPEAATKASESSSPVQHSTLLNIDEQSVLLTAQTLAKNPMCDKSEKIRLIFDSGSHRSYITAQCSSKLGLHPIQSEPLQIAVFGSKRTLTVPSKRVAFEIQQLNGQRKTIYAHTSPVITNCPINAKQLTDADLSVVHAANGVLADDPSVGETSIDVLIGSDYFWEFLGGNPLVTPSGLFLVPSALGLLVGGRCRDDSDQSHNETALLCLTESFSPQSESCGYARSRMVPEYPDIDQYWQLESLGIVDLPNTQDDEEALKQFYGSVSQIEGRYFVSWPWKPSAADLPTNYEFALGRFKSLARRLFNSDRSILKKYKEVLDNQMKLGVIERVGDIACAPHQLHYLPHHPIVKPSSTTTKVRIVYDASAKTKKDNPSLNECLYRGPVLLPDICEILIRFRLHPIAIIADVEKAFLQIGLHQRDRDVTRFFWFKEIDSCKIDENLDIYRFCRVPFGVISSPFLLGATLQYHLSKCEGWVAKKIATNIYVDNIICGVDNKEDALRFFNDAQRMFSSASMTLQEWGSNSTCLLDHIPEKYRVHERCVKVLGLQWNTIQDTLSLSLNTTMKQNTNTKRQVMQTIASFFDPLGLFQPVFVKMKLFLQRLWLRNKDWDEPLEPDDKREWMQLWTDVFPVFDLIIPRHCAPFSQNVQDVTVCVFCDASVQSYAASAYLRVFERETNEWTTALVYSKSRLSPKKKDASTISMPRLELLGVTIGVRLAQFVRKAIDMPFSKVFIFTDSTCVLHWLRSPKPLSVFVENRIKEIKTLSDCEFFYVRSGENPADFNTRGMPATDLKTSSLWWCGPPWLMRSHNQWPAAPDAQVLSGTSSLLEDEYRRSPPVFHSFLVGQVNQKTTMRLLNIDPTRYSTFRGMLRITTMCLKFLKLILWTKIPSSQFKHNLPCKRIFEEITDEPHISATDLRLVKKLWVKRAQLCEFRELRDCVQSGRGHHLIKQLGVAKDPDGVMRCYGRFQHSDIPYDAIQPMLLPKRNILTDMIIREVHERHFHAGVAHTLSQVRREFWVPHGRNVVKRIISGCRLCRKYKGSSFVLPKMPPWPRQRVSRSNPFQFTGLDYFGPINVKTMDGNQKSWICLFTCLAIRAVHLECVEDFTAQSFLQCLIRFISRRGIPEEIICDNAPQFRITKTVFDNIWHSIFVSRDVQSYASQKGITWKFTVELAPWQGGFYERLVGVVKNALKVAIGRRLLRYVELVTLIAEAVVNSRPLTYVPSEFDSRPALRPIDFLTELAVGMPNTNAAMDLGRGDASRKLVRLWKGKQGRLNELWRQWYDDYLLSLREYGQTLHKGQRGRIGSSPRVGDVVIVKEADSPRGCWKLAMVDEVVTSSDGSVRSAKVRLPNGYVIGRSVGHLYPLEVETTTEEPENIDFEGFSEADVEEAEDRRIRLRCNNIQNGLNLTAYSIGFEASVK